MKLIKFSTTARDRSEKFGKLSDLESATAVSFETSDDTSCKAEKTTKSRIPEQEENL